MKAVHSVSMVAFSVIMIGVGAAVAKADTTHDHSDHTMHAKMVSESPDSVAHTAIDSAAQHQIDSMVKAYLVISDQLAHDRLDSLSSPFAQMALAAQILAKRGPGGVAEQAAKIANKVPVEVKDIEHVRASFQALSAELISLVENAPPSMAVGVGINKASCPMKSAAWLQKGSDILNPYYGSAMLSCGTITGEVKALSNN
ncbi:MAG: Cu(I)/Ag(I) efflux system membrane fusion protein [Planctomycetota bacterium]|jgi:Cu(I)/Ag(I) efflux system membrane fusion protein